MKLHTKAAALLILALLTTCSLGPALLVYIVDPYQIYHKSLFKEVKYNTNQSYVHAGWINQLLSDPAQNYQGIVIGSSTMANYTQSLINQYLHWGNTLNLSLNGGSPKMQHMTAHYALERAPNLKHILWDIHAYYAFDPDPRMDDNPTFHFPYHLYTATISDDAPYLFNISNVINGFHILTGNYSDFSADIEDNGPFYKTLLEQGQYDAYGTQANRKAKLLPPLLENITRVFPDNEYYRHQTFPSLDQYLLDVILPRCNSDIDIIISFSPATRYFYASMLDIGYLNKQILLRRYIVEKTQGCNNIRVFAFDNLDWIVNDLNNYADDFHYRIHINEYVLASFAKNENRLTVDNIDAYEKTFFKNIESYKNVFLSELTK